MNSLKVLVENELGYNITNEEMRKSENYAKHKLNWIIKREGDGKGKRLETNYLVKLIAETFFEDSITKMNTKKDCIAH